MTRPLGLSRRELERQIAWILRNPPEEPRALAKALASALVTLIDKNNERLAQTIEGDESPDVKEDF